MERARLEHTTQSSAVSSAPPALVSVAVHRQSRDPLTREGALHQLMPKASGRKSKNPAPTGCLSFFDLKEQEEGKAVKQHTQEEQKKIEHDLKKRKRQEKDYEKSRKAAVGGCWRAWAWSKSGVARSRRSFTRGAPGTSSGTPSITASAINHTAPQLEQLTPAELVLSPTVELTGITHIAAMIVDSVSVPTGAQPHLLSLVASDSDTDVDCVGSGTTTDSSPHDSDEGPL